MISTTSPSPVHTIGSKTVNSRCKRLSRSNIRSYGSVDRYRKSDYFRLHRCLTNYSLLLKCRSRDGLHQKLFHFWCVQTLIRSNSDFSGFISISYWPIQWKLVITKTHIPKFRLHRSSVLGPEIRPYLFCINTHVYNELHTHVQQNIGYKELIFPPVLMYYYVYFTAYNKVIRHKHRKKNVFCTLVSHIPNMFWDSFKH